MLTRHLLQREGKWKKQVQAQRHVAAPVKVHILLPLILMVKLHLQRHCSQQTLQTAITQKPSSSSLTEKQRISCPEDLHSYKLGSTFIVFSHPSSLWLTGYRNVCRFKNVFQSYLFSFVFQYIFLALSLVSLDMV